MTPSGFQRSLKRGKLLVRAIDQGQVLLSLMAEQVGVFGYAAANRLMRRVGWLLHPSFKIVDM